MISKLRHLIEIIEKILHWKRWLKYRSKPACRLKKLIEHVIDDCEYVYGSGNPFPLPSSIFRLYELESHHIRKCFEHFSGYVMQRCYCEHYLEKIKSPEDEFDLEQALRSVRSLDIHVSKKQPEPLIIDHTELIKAIKNLKNDNTKSPDIIALAEEALTHLQKGMKKPECLP